MLPTLHIFNRCYTYFDFRCIVSRIIVSYSFQLIFCFVRLFPFSLFSCLCARLHHSFNEDLFLSPLLCLVCVSWSLLSPLFVCLPFLLLDWLDEKLLFEHLNNRCHCLVWMFVCVSALKVCASTNQLVCTQSCSCDEYRWKYAMCICVYVCPFATFDLFRHFGRTIAFEFDFIGFVFRQWQMYNNRTKYW